MPMAEDNFGTTKAYNRLIWLMKFSPNLLVLPKKRESFLMCIEGKMKVINQLKHQAQYQLARGQFLSIFFSICCMDQAQYIGAKTNELMDWKAKETFSIHLDPLKNPTNELGRHVRPLSLRLMPCLSKTRQLVKTKKIYL